MSREHCVIKKMRFPNVNGLVELSRRTGTTSQDLNDDFSADRLIRIDGNSCLHETCNRALENRNLFYNYRHVIKEAIANSFRMCNENETLRMEKHACYNLTLREVIISLIRKHLFRDRFIFTRSENKMNAQIVEEVMKHRTNRLKISARCLHEKFENDLDATINETTYEINKNKIKSR